MPHHTVWWRKTIPSATAKGSHVCDEIPRSWKPVMNRELGLHLPWWEPLLHLSAQGGPGSNF